MKKDKNNQIGWGWFFIVIAIFTKNTPLALLAIFLWWECIDKSN